MWTYIHSCGHTYTHVDTVITQLLTGRAITLAPMLAASLIIFPALCKLLDLSVPTSSCIMENLKPKYGGEMCSLHWLATLEMSIASAVLVTVRD